MNFVATPVTVYSSRTTYRQGIFLTTLLGAGLLFPVTMLLGFTTSDFVVYFVSWSIFSMLLATSQRITIGSNGLSIRLGVFGWRNFRCTLNEIKSVETVECSRANWWFQLRKTPEGNFHYINRPGPAVRVTLIDGRYVTASIDDPAAAIASFNEARSTSGD